jgi:hypothetical protein
MKNTKRDEMNSLRLKVELHTHTDFDPSDLINYSARQLIDEAARQGFDVLAITCHDALQWSQSLSEYAASAGIQLARTAYLPKIDATAQAMNFTRGAVLFSKPKNSGPIQLQSGAISGAITGSTGFISTVPMQGTGRSKGKGTTTIVGMLEGNIHGGSRWTDSAGKAHDTPFRLGPGEMLVARPDGMPRVAQFDIPRFVKTSPLIKGFKAPLPNATAVERVIADYEADDRHGFVDKTNIRVSSGPINMALVGQVLPLDTVAQLQTKNPNGLLPVGTTGIIQAQLIWNTSADLDLYLTLPTGQVVSFSNVSVTFNNGRAFARLDQDNRGGTIDIPPRTRVENISINGIPLAGLYTFFANNFSSPNGTDPFILRVFYNGQVQVINGVLGVGQNSQSVVVQFPHR